MLSLSQSAADSHFAFELLDTAQEWSPLVASLNLPAWTFGVGIFVCIAGLLFALRYLFGGAMLTRSQKKLTRDLQAALARIEDLENEIDALWDELEAKESAERVDTDRSKASRDRFQLSP